MAPDQPPDTSRLDPFRVGDWLAEPKACRISRGDANVKLRPQLMDLLVCLARRPGDIVLREEIFAEVWPGQYVAESGLSRCVAELRQNLQDDAQHPTYVETIPKRGYRLLAPVVRVAVPPVSESIPGGAVQAPAEPQPGGPGLESDGAGAAAVTHTEVTAHRAASPVRRAVVWGFLAVALVAVVVIGLVMVMRTPVSALTERDTVLLADTRNDTGDEVFDDTLRLALGVNLGQAPFLRILPDDLVRSAVLRAGRQPGERVTGTLALDLCRREGAAAVLMPSIAPVGSRYAVGIEAIACGSGEEIGRALETARDKERVLDALESAANRIRRRLGESRESLRQHSVPLVRATTPSLEALQALTLGDYYRDHAKPADALAMYRQATELDPNFALAWARRGAAASNLEVTAEVIPAFRRAYELRDRVTAPERFYISAGYYRMVEGDPDRTIDVYRAWKQMYPGSPIPPTNLASTLTGWLGHYEQALPEAREAVRLAPYSSLASVNLVVASLGVGDVAGARAAVAEAASRGQDDLNAHQHRVFFALLDGDAAALERETRWASTSPAARLWVLRARAGHAWATGRLREARRLSAEVVALAAQSASVDALADVHFTLGEAEALLGDPLNARRALEDSLALEADAVIRVQSGIMLLFLGHATEARNVLAAIQNQSPANPRVRRVWMPNALALDEAFRGRTEEASRFLQPALRFERGHGFNLVPIGVRALIEQTTGHPDRAAEAFGELIRLRGPHVVSRWVPFARLRLARALRDAGDSAGSLAAYDAFLASWKDADPDAPLLLAAKRERAALAATR